MSRITLWLIGMGAAMAVAGCAGGRDSMRVAVEGQHFVLTDGVSSTPFVPWGFNYDRTVVDGRDMLLEDVVRECPQIIDEDFAAMRQRGGNVARVFIGTADILADAGHVDAGGLERLDRVLAAADGSGIRLILVGLATLRPASIPAWMQNASDEQLEDAEELFWRTVARRCRGRSAIFTYDLQNEPVICWNDSKELIVGCFGMPDGQKFCYVHRRYRHIGSRWTQHVQSTYGNEDALRKHWPDYPRAGETWQKIVIPPFDGKDSRFGEYLAWQKQLAQNWAKRMAGAIRAEDPGHLVTVGALDPTIMSEAVDFYCYHLYPRPTKPGEDYLAVNEKEWRERLASLPKDKPLVIEEFFPLYTPERIKPTDLLATMLRVTKPRCAGWVSFYWGAPDRLRWSTPSQRAQYESWLAAWSAGPG